MNRNFIFVLVLLVTLSTVNAIPHQLYKRTTTFDECPKAPSGTVLLNVVLSPDPVVAGQTDTFTITAKFNKDVDANAQIVAAFADPDVIEPIFQDDICKYTKCPVPSGTELTAKVPIPVPASLPTTNYGIGVAIANSPDEVLGCAIAIVGQLAPPDVLDFI